MCRFWSRNANRMYCRQLFLGEGLISARNFLLFIVGPPPSQYSLRNYFEGTWILMQPFSIAISPAVRCYREGNMAVGGSVKFIGTILMVAYTVSLFKFSNCLYYLFSAFCLIFFVLIWIFVFVLIFIFLSGFCCQLNSLLAAEIIRSLLLNYLKFPLWSWLKDLYF